MDGIFGLWWIILLVIFIIRSYGKEQPVSNPSPALCDATLHVQGLWRTVKDIERRQGKNSIELATHLRSLADIHFAKGELPEAEALIHRVLTVQKSNLPADSPDMFGTLACLTNIAAAQGNHDAAVDLVRTRISIVEESTPHHDSASVRASTTSSPSCCTRRANAPRRWKLSAKPWHVAKERPPVTIGRLP
jgi:hypothetical protein